MRIEFVNHSSFIVRSGKIVLLCDFWNDGSAFDEGWKLLCPSVMEYSKFASITHIWFSHEHPDHFSPAELRRIPEQLRRDITVLFQRTKDKRVVGFCKSLGFKDVVELSPWSAHTLAEGFDVSCATYGADWGDVDSWLCIKTPECTVLNLNDCEIEDRNDLQRIKEHAGKIDLLTVQFSFASKQGDVDDPSWIDMARDYHLDLLGIKVGALAPQYTLPFASFVYWCHQENRYLNDGVIPVQAACERIDEAGSAAVVLYPGDTWTVGSEWDNGPSLRLYQDRYDWLAALPLSEFVRHEPVSAKDLQRAASAMIEKLCENASGRQVRQYLALQHSSVRCGGKTSRLWSRLDALWSIWRERCQESLIHVEDLGMSFEFSLRNGLTPIGCSVDQCHVKLGSKALHFCFAAPFGGETLQVNGRFQNITPNGWRYLRCIFFLYRRLDQQFTLPNNLLIDRLGRIIGLRRPLPK